MIGIGQRVIYRDVSGYGNYPAVITRVRADDLVDIEVEINKSYSLALTRISIGSHPGECLWQN